MSLAERQALQRAKQLEFLKGRGLIKDETEVRGGAGASPSCDTSSVASTNISGAAGSAISFPGSNLSPRSQRLR